MERKLPIGIQSFSKIIEGGYAYVDKTALLYNMVTSGCVFFLSRPRRFGKSLLVSTLDAYFSGRSKLFTGLAIEKLEKEWKKYPVFRFDMSGVNYNTQNALVLSLDYQLSEYEATYQIQSYKANETDKKEMLSIRFDALLKTAHKKTGLPCVVLVDEYDKPMLDIDNDEALNMASRQLFKAFFGVLKKCDEHLRFAFFTGITKFSGVSIFSDLNQLQNISLDTKYSTICGITQEELENNFKTQIQVMANSNSYTYDECIARLKSMYDGYHFADDLINVYNPFGLFNALSQKRFGYFWYDQSTPTILLERIKKNNWNFVDYLEGVTADAATLGNIEINKNDPTPLLYQSGYLTIKDYERETQSFTLAYPNKEVRIGFVKAIAPRYLTTDDAVQALDVLNFRKDLLIGDLTAMFTRLKAVYAGLPYPENSDKSKTLERDYRNVAHIVFTLLGGISNCENHFSHGRTDCIVQMPKYIYIFEFKLDKSADEAIAQIDKMGYAEPFKADERKVLKVGVCFSSELRNIKDWKAVCLGTSHSHTASKVN